MNINNMNPIVDFYFNNAEKWRDEFNSLRLIILDCGLNEELKWGCPCYTFQNGNIVLIHGFKDYCALLFFKGALMPDVQRILIQQTDNVQAGRQIRFTNVQEIATMESILKAYIFEAIEVEKAGLKVEFIRKFEHIVPEELLHKFDTIPDLKSAFDSLTLGRQRAYIFFFSQPKQSKTRESRIEKCIPKILSKKGLND